jgi:hypothetical protein
MRAAVLRDSTNPTGIAQFGAVQAVAQSFGVELRPVDARDAGEIERSIASFARAANGGRWRAAGRHILTKVQGPLNSWLSAFPRALVVPRE